MPATSEIAKNFRENVKKACSAKGISNDVKLTAPAIAKLDLSFPWTCEQATGAGAERLAEEFSQNKKPRKAFRGPRIKELPC